MATYVNKQLQMRLGLCRSRLRPIRHNLFLFYIIKVTLRLRSKIYLEFTVVAAVCWINLDKCGPACDRCLLALQWWLWWWWNCLF